jgi:uncharacterized protein HemX
VLDQYLGPGFIVTALGLVFAAFRLNRSDAKEAVETAGMNTDQAMKRAESAETREKDLRDRLARAEAEIDALRRKLRENGIDP